MSIQCTQCIPSSILTCSLYFREHPAKEVYVTGTFDDWARSVKLDNKGSCFEKVVELPLANKKIYYKVGVILAITRPGLICGVSHMYHDAEAIWIFSVKEELLGNIWSLSLC